LGNQIGDVTGVPGISRLSTPRYRAPPPGKRKKKEEMENRRGLELRKGKRISRK
jgi:hypothetical protein